MAYKTATADALANAETETRTFDTNLAIRFPYMAMNNVMKALKDSSAKIRRQSFDSDCQIDISIRLSERDSVTAKLKDTDGVSVEEKE